MNGRKKAHSEIDEVREVPRARSIKCICRKLVAEYLVEMMLVHWHISEEVNYFVGIDENVTYETTVKNM